MNMLHWSLGSQITHFLLYGFHPPYIADSMLCCKMNEARNESRLALASKHKMMDVWFMHLTLRFCRNTDPNINFVGHVPPFSALSFPALYNQRVNKHCDKKSSIVREYHSARVHNCGVLTTDLLAETFNSRQPISSICMDNIGCSNTKRFNYIAQYSERKVLQEICYIQAKELKMT